MSELKPWPKERDFAAIQFEDGGYAMGNWTNLGRFYKAQYEAALERLTIALDALQTIADGSPVPAETAQRAIDRIGEVK